MNMQISSPPGQTSVPHGTAIDSRRFRSLMGAFPTGVAVIATGWNGELYGATINSLTSVSLQPCMLLFCTNEGSATGAAIRSRKLFSVNILGHHQSDLSTRFTRKQKNRFEGLAVAFSADGLPLLERGRPPNSAAASPRSTRRATTKSSWAKLLSGNEIACNPLVFHKGAYGIFQRA